MQQTKKPRRLRRILLVLLAAALLLAAGGLVFAGNYLFHFALDPAAPDGMLYSDDSQDWEPDETTQWFLDNAQDRWLTSRDGLSLHALYLPAQRLSQILYLPADSHRYAILCHGYGGIPASMSHFAQRFSEMGFHILAPAARAHEQSEGRYVTMGWMERLDVVDWVKLLVEEDPEARIFLFGVSMGGATVMMASGEELPENVKCIIEDCGYSSVWDEFALQLEELFQLPAFPILNAASLVCQIQAGYSFREASSVAQLQRATLPMLFIHGEADTFVPYSMLDVVYEACASPDKQRLSIPYAVHANSAWTDPELYWFTVEEFLARHMG